VETITSSISSRLTILRIASSGIGSTTSPSSPPVNHRSEASVLVTGTTR
jgi:hypothetical protein